MRRRILRWILAGVLRRARAGGMSDAEVYAAMDVEAGHPVLGAVREILARAEEDCVREACGSATEGDARECAFWLGGRHALALAGEYLEAARTEAVRRAQS